MAARDGALTVNLSYSFSQRTQMPDLTAIFPISTVFSEGILQPGGQGARIWMNFGPGIERAFFTLL